MSAATRVPGVLPRADRGTTSIADSVVAKIVALVVREIEGVAGLGGPLSGAMGQVVGRVRGKEHDTSGVAVEVGETEAAVDLTVRLQYPIVLYEIADLIRARGRPRPRAGRADRRRGQRRGDRPGVPRGRRAR